MYVDLEWESMPDYGAMTWKTQAAKWKTGSITAWTTRSGGHDRLERMEEQAHEVQ